VLDPAGEELLRDSSRLGTPIGYAGGGVIVARRSKITAMNPATGQSTWTDFVQSEVTVTGDAVWSLDPTGGTVARIDPKTGAPQWTAPIGISHGFAVAADDETAYVATVLAVFALDAATGKQLWWQHIPYQALVGD
jgi:outer membrane protein assembly factor BamB